MISGYINSVPFSVYDCGEIMILDDHYIKWLPSYIHTGTFTIEGSTYNFSDYSSGMFTWSTATITSFAFRSNTNISSIETDALYISWGAFASCGWLQNANLLYCSEIGSHAFRGCTYLSNVNASNCSYVSYYAFAECNNLREVSLTKCTYLGDNAFAECSNLSEISLPNVEHIDSYVFTWCRLNELSLPKCEFIGDRAFYSNSTFSTITLGGSSVCVLENSRAFENTGITSSTGSIYVPRYLYSSYVVASEWSYFYNRIYPIGSISNTYIRWTPSTLTGTFSIDYQTYNFSDYSGYFDGFDFITSHAFESTGVQHIETNTPSVDAYAFNSCSSLTSVDMSVCSYISTNAFIHCNLYKLSIPMCEYVGNYAFWDNKHLCQYDDGYLNLPVCSYVGIGGFGFCSSLKSVNLPECKFIDNTAFTRCDNLESISLPECVHIGRAAFGNCSHLSEINLPKCTDISSRAFRGETYRTPLYSITLSSYTMCSLQNSDAFSLTNITTSTGYIIVAGSRWMDYKYASEWSYFSDRIFSINGQSNYMSWTPASLSGTIKYLSATYNLSDYSSGYFSMFDRSISAASPDSWRDSHEWGSLFYGNSKIETLEMSVEYLRGPLFANCTSLSYVKLIGCSVLYESVFKGCTNLQEIDLPSCKSIGTEAFCGCSSLSIVSIPVCSYIGAAAFENCSGIVELTIPECENISGAFNGCYNLERVSLPVCSRIGWRAFKGCNKLSDVYAPNCSCIYYETFGRCYSLSNITLHNCRTIETGAFEEAGLQTITIDSNVLCSIVRNDDYFIDYSSPFTGCPLSGIFVPSDMVNAYKIASYWSSYSSIIYPIPV